MRFLQARAKCGVPGAQTSAGSRRYCPLAWTSTAWLKSVPSSFHQIACKNKAFPCAKLGTAYRNGPRHTGGATKYLDTILMPLWSCRLSPGSAAILAASGAGETPTLPGKTRQEFLSRYLVTAPNWRGELSHYGDGRRRVNCVALRPAAGAGHTLQDGIG